MNIIEQIENLAVQCMKTDYSNSHSVKEHNRAVNKIRELVSNINNEEIITKLLKNKNTRTWVSFQSLEEPDKLSKEIFKGALSVLNLVSQENVTESMAAEMRLKELNIQS